MTLSTMSATKKVNQCCPRKDKKERCGMDGEEQRGKEERPEAAWAQAREGREAQKYRYGPEERICGDSPRTDAISLRILHF
jgi:hypothetical protein